MNDLSSEDREKAKKLWEQIVQARSELSGMNLHKTINEAAKSLY